MPLVNINKIMQEQFHGAPSLLCIDTEGLDLDILKTLDFTRFRPAIVCVETLKIGTTRVRDGDPRPDAGEGLRRSRRHVRQYDLRR